MSDLKSKFERAVQSMQNRSSRPDSVTLLKLHALHKQATVGNVTGRRPGFTDYPGRAKYDAWAKLQGASRDAAMQAYIDLVAQLKI